MPIKRTVKDWEVDGETKLLSTGDKGEGFRKAHAIVRPRDFTHRRVVGFAYRAEDARLFAAAGELLTMLQHARECIAYCRRAHKDAQSGSGFPIEIMIDELITRATSKAKL